METEIIGTEIDKLWIFQNIAPTKIYVSDLVLQSQLYFVKAVFDNKTYYYKFANLR